MLRNPFLFILITLPVLLLSVAVVSAQGPHLLVNGGCVAGDVYDPACDVNRDGDTNIVDLELVATHWRQEGVWTSDGDFWSSTGNAGTDPAIHFLGTVDNQPLVFRTNGVERMRITTDDKLVIGRNTITIDSNLDTITTSVTMTLTVSDTVALRLAPTTSTPNLIGGYSGNSVTAGVVGATIGGGGSSGAINRVTDDYATVGGGAGNTASNWHATVGGGAGNTASNWHATVGGGRDNIANGIEATVSGGAGNTAGAYATVGGGRHSSASSAYATVGGGSDNTASGSTYPTVGGGRRNTASWAFATVGGGSDNTASGYAAAVGGGFGNQATADYATIAGGGRSDSTNSATGNRVTDMYGTVGGGGNNQAGNGNTDLTDARYPTVGGGRDNNASGRYATVGGGRSNNANDSDATVGGGNFNTASGQGATVGGGRSNNAQGVTTTVAGGEANSASGGSATVGGGASNSATGTAATVGGGVSNSASGEFGTVGGGVDNTAQGDYATVPGGHDNDAVGNYSFAAGHHARAKHQGAFVWADSTPADFVSTAANQFLIRASGGVGIGTKSPEAQLHVKGDMEIESTGTHSSLFISAESSATDDPAVRFVNSSGTAEWAILQAGGQLRFWDQVGSHSEVIMETDGDVSIPHGNVGIGTTSPGNILTVVQNSATDPIADAWTTYSSQEYKQYIRELTPQEYQQALEALLGTRVVRFRYKGQGLNAKEKIGLIAEEAPKEILAEGDSKAVSLNEYISLVHAAMRAQQAQIEAQQQLLAVQQRRIEQLQAELERLAQELSKK